MSCLSCLAAPPDAYTGPAAAAEPCGHAFHEGCALRALDGGRTCPADGCGRRVRLVRARDGEEGDVPVRVSLRGVQFEVRLRGGEDLHARCSEWSGVPLGRLKLVAGGRLLAAPVDAAALRGPVLVVGTGERLAHEPATGVAGVARKAASWVSWVSPAAVLDGASLFVRHIFQPFDPSVEEERRARLAREGAGRGGAREDGSGDE